MDGEEDINRLEIKMKVFNNELNALRLLMTFIRPDQADRTSHVKSLPPTPHTGQNTSSFELKGSQEKRKLPDPKSEKLGDKSGAHAKMDATASESKSGKLDAPAKSYDIITASESWSLAESIDRYSVTRCCTLDRKHFYTYCMTPYSHFSLLRNYNTDYTFLHC